MNLYEIYFINLYKPPLNIDDKAQDNLTIQLPELKWEEFIPSKWEDWKIELSSDDMWGWHKDRNQKIFLDD